MNSAWIVADDHHTSPIRIWDANKTLIAQTIADQREGIDPQANAHLIAAAPEMLNALEELVTYYDLLGTKGTFYEKVKSIIKKASAK